MALFRVVITASYPVESVPLDEAGGGLFWSDEDEYRLPAGLADNASEWASAEPSQEGESERSWEIDHSISPVRATAAATYTVEADDGEAAERIAQQRFAAGSLEHGLSGPESVMAAADPV